MSAQIVKDEPRPGDWYLDGIVWAEQLEEKE
jgi:hypothetical protein